MSISEMKWEIRQIKLKLSTIDQISQSIVYYNLVRALLLLQNDLINALIKEREALNTQSTLKAA